MKLEPSVGQETRFGCEGEDLWLWRRPAEIIVEQFGILICLKPLGCRVNDSTEAVLEETQSTAGDLRQFCCFLAAVHFFPLVDYSGFL